MKDSVANLLIACRFDLASSEHERHENKRRLAGDATMERSTTEVTHLSRSFAKSSMLPFISTTTRSND